MTYQLDESRKVREQHLVGETLVLSESECEGLVRSTFSRGTLKLAQAKGSPHIVCSTIEDSTVIAVKRQRNGDFFSTRFIRCKFQGYFSVNFGSEGRGNIANDFGGVETCDFSEAVLDGCRFVNTDVSSLNLPRWPHVVLLQPHARTSDVAKVQWPGGLGKYMQVKSSAAVNAEVLHIPSVMKLNASLKQAPFTEEEARAAFEQFGGVVM